MSLFFIFCWPICLLASLFLFRFLFLPRFYGQFSLVPVRYKGMQMEARGQLWLYPTASPQLWTEIRVNLFSLPWCYPDVTLMLPWCYPDLTLMNIFFLIIVWPLSYWRGSMRRCGEECLCFSHNTTDLIKKNAISAW